MKSELDRCIGIDFGCSLEDENFSSGSFTIISHGILRALSLSICSL